MSPAPCSVPSRGPIRKDPEYLEPLVCARQGKVMRWIMMLVVMTMFAACSGEESQPRPARTTMTAPSARPLQQNKTADVKTETGAEHFQHGMPEPGALMETLKQSGALSAPEQQAAAEKVSPTPPAGMRKPARAASVSTGVNKPVETAAPVKVTGTAWKKCRSCHAFTSKAKVGPGLGKGGGVAGVFGRRAGTAPGFSYAFTRYVRGNAWVWDDAHLRKWMCDSRKAIREFTGDAHAKTKMPPQRICNPEDQDSVLSKLKSIS